MAGMPNLNPAKGFEIAADAAGQASEQARQLSNLQWQRQMEGLGQAKGYTNQLQSLYNSMYSPGGGAPAAGGVQVPPGGGGGMPPSAMSQLPPGMGINWKPDFNTQREPNPIPGVDAINNSGAMNKLNSILGGPPTVTQNPDGTITREAPNNWYTKHVGKPISHAGTKVVNTIKGWV